MFRILSCLIGLLFVGPNTLALENGDGNRILRRLTLDLTGRLPTTTQRQQFATQPIHEFIDELLANEQFSAQAAELQTWVWGLRKDNQRILERFKTNGNSTLVAGYDATAKDEIRQEPTLQLRYLLDNDLPWTNLFTGHHLASSTGNLGLWGLTNEENLWSDAGSFGRAELEADKPNIGVLLSPGLHANINLENRGDLYPKVRKLLDTFHCDDYFSRDAHRFHTLSESDVATDLRSYAESNSACASCHLHTANLVTPLAGLYEGTSFSSWLSYATPTSTTGTFVGHQFDDLTEFGTQLSQDPRIKLCNLKRTIQALQQTPFTDGNDYQTLLLASHVFQKYELKLKPAIKIIALSGGYQRQPLTSSAKKKSRFKVSGARYLSQRHWRGISDQLIPNHSTIVFDERLDPGNADKISEARRIPNAAYWFAVNRTARQLATAIVDQELTTTTTAAERKVFQSLGDGIETELTDDQARTQIVALWLSLADLNLDSGDARVIRLVSLWRSIAGDAPDTSTMAGAWETTLLGILLSPDFLML